MKPQKAGRIIITTSVAATRIEPAIGAAYMAAKAGIKNLMRSVALELAAYNITVNAIAPGYIVTNIGNGHAHNPVEQKAVARTIPMHRVGYPRDMYGLALFFASPASEYITGQDLVEWQVRVAAGEKLPLSQQQLHIDGHAIEVRICAEEPDADFLPSTGRLSLFEAPPLSAHTRLDTGVVAGDSITPFYDPMIAKLIVWDETRAKRSGSACCAGRFARSPFGSVMAPSTVRSRRCTSRQ